MSEKDVIDVQYLDKTRLHEILNQLPDPRQLKNSTLDSLIKVQGLLDELKETEHEMDQAALDDFCTRLEHAAASLEERQANYASLEALMTQVPDDFDIYLLGRVPRRTCRIRCG